jgi:hypothetical protein
MKVSNVCFGGNNRRTLVITDFETASPYEMVSTFLD